jgi:hypothetical protein
MSVDGANLGVPAGEALKAVLGDEQPKTKLSKEEMLAKVMAAPDYYEPATAATDEDYTRACFWLAKQFYLIRKDGIEGDSWALYQEMKKRCGDRDYGFSGFMVGYANNLSRWLLDLPETDNPAIVTIGA